MKIEGRIASQIEKTSLPLLARTQGLKFHFGKRKPATGKQTKKKQLQKANEKPRPAL
jgi:hypothetical protein